MGIFLPDRTWTATPPLTRRRYIGTYPPLITTSPASLDWQLNGNAVINGTSWDLTSATNGQRGSAVRAATIGSTYVDITFDFYIGDGGGADGTTLALIDPAINGQNALGAGGADLAFGDLTGYCFAFVTNGQQGLTAPFVGIGHQSGTTPIIWDYTNQSLAALTRNVTHSARVTVINGAATIYLDGSSVLTGSVTLVSPAVRVAFTAATGGINDRHAVSNVTIQSVGLPTIGFEVTTSGIVTAEAFGSATLTFQNFSLPTISAPMRMLGAGLHF